MLRAMDAPYSQSEQVLIIKPSSAWRSVDLRELWKYRELLYFFVWRDVKVRYKQTTLGITWAILQPFLAMVTFTFFFGKIAKLPSDGIPYPLFAYAALLPWNLFSSSVTAGSMSLIAGSNLITKVYFPRIIIPIAAVLTVLVDFLVACVMLIPLMIWWKAMPSSAAFVGVPLSIAVTLIFAMGLTTWLSAMVVRFRDLRHVIPFVVQIWLFATPIVYPLSLVPERFRWLVALNPMVAAVETFRGSLFGKSSHPGALIWSFLAGVILLMTGGVFFRRLERMFADVI